MAWTEEARQAAAEARKRADQASASAIRPGGTFEQRAAGHEAAVHANSFAARMSEKAGEHELANKHDNRAGDHALSAGELRSAAAPQGSVLTSTHNPNEHHGSTHNAGG